MRYRDTSSYLNKPVFEKVRTLGIVNPHREHHDILKLLGTAPPSYVQYLMIELNLFLLEIRLLQLS